MMMFIIEKNIFPKKMSKSAANAGRDQALFLANLLPKQKGRLLDVGCGLGIFLEQLKGSQFDLWGIDISETATRIAKEKVEKSEQIICADAIPLPFDNAEFDIVTAWGSIEHFPSTASILKEIERVLKPDGRAIIMVPNIYYYKFVWDALRKGKGPVKHQEIENLYAFKEWKRLLEQSGLIVVKSGRHNKFNKPHLKWLRKMIPFYFSNHFIYFCRKALEEKAA